MDQPPSRDGLMLELTASELFDPDFYLRRNGDVARAGEDALAHFVDFGWAEERWPNRYFDPRWYRRENADVVAASADPLLHYIRYGDREGRRPHPLFDPAWYRQAYAVPDGQITLGHFLTHRAGGRVAPSAALFAVPLLARRGDADPVEAYLDATEASGQEAFPDLEIVRASGLVEENYYLINAADVHEANIDACRHYCEYGWREQRKPNLYFDPVWYSATNPDAGTSRVNPLVHYILVGEPAGRRPAPYFDPAWYRTEYGIAAGESALAHYLANRRRQVVSPTPLFDVSWYVARFGLELGPNRDPFAHYLYAGMTQDIDPALGFDAAEYRRRHLGRPSRGFTRSLRAEQHNPLVHYLRAHAETSS